jgi:adenylate cyclase
VSGVKPRIAIAGTDRVVEGDLTTSLLNTLLRGGVGIDTVCGGKAQCGRCAVRILSGGRNLSPVRDAEAARLKSLGVGPDTRLACQTYSRGDVEIEVVNWRRREG